MSNRIQVSLSHSPIEWARTMVQSVKTEILRVGKKSKRKRIKRKDGDTLGEINESARKKKEDQESEHQYQITFHLQKTMYQMKMQLMLLVTIMIMMKNILQQQYNVEF